ncbi:MAG: MarR family transcriptional regulator [Atopobiaceae bacterium]|jgi:DNA-binding MarR family transcriptional regulator|nr:MarR family transcriptional regulator [Atopobiaceae bacterium]MCH4179985.1 MarR family transcriptional regulator [Atopobiaceae bacterium]MCH4213736.1 MarR family transcriptional regulator [Atopobiaceae bacterium]MCH4230081.1 MarR family transcriptional regulator [Atopobiaceae bacterium]MCH4275907.1 MarR family transcriptional regulator [Atopobiaceae bacterium]
MAGQQERGRREAAEPTLGAAMAQRARSGVPLTPSFAAELNDLLAATYGSIDVLEGQLLNRGHGLDVSVSESHLLDAIGHATLHGAGTISVSQLAEAADIRVPSATAAVNRMVAKGLVEKHRSAHDGRRFDLTLTHSGEAVFRLHAIFHQHMAEAVAGDMTSEEREILLEGIRRLEHFYAEAREA